MGNFLWRCLGGGDDSESDTPVEQHYPGQYSRNGYGGYCPPRPGPDTVPVFGLRAFYRDLKEFQTTLEGLLKFYHLPWPIVSYNTKVLWLPVPTTQPLIVPVNKPYREKPKPSGTQPIAAEAIEGVQYKIHTLPVKWNKDNGDGDGFTVFVNVLENARETKLLPKEIHDATLLRHKARAQKSYKIADALQKKIEDAGYRVFDGKNGGARCLAHKYSIRLRGVDAPEIMQPYGKEARDVLRSLVKDQELLICVYDIDPIGRTVGDIYCNGMFIQEELLKKGSVWHYKYFDKRETFAEWQRAARVACVGLWANPNPEPPWDYKRRDRKENPFRIRRA